MKTQAVFVKYMAGLLVVLFVAGCATPGPRGSYLERIEPDSIAHLTAYYAGDSLEIQYPLRGRDAFAHATWTSAQSSASQYRCQCAVLTFEKEKRAARKSVANLNNRLIIRDPAQWKQLLHAVLVGLSPDKPGHGILLLVQNMEIVAFRDAASALKIVNLDSKSPGIVVDHTFSDADESIQALCVPSACQQRHGFFLSVKSSSKIAHA